VTKGPGVIRIVLIGAGSVKFTLGLVRDLLADGGEWELRLVDISPENLEIARRLGRAHGRGPRRTGDRQVQPRSA
jgi:alpha-galactosidase/6-phospho-beta-glucosidase family protein